MYFADIFEQTQNRQPDHCAIVFKGEEISYRQLMARSWQVGNALQAMGIPRQERVAHLAKNSPEFYEIFFGGCATGLATAGINWRLAGPEIEQLLNYTGNSVLFVGQEFYQTVEAIEDQLEHVKHIIALDGGHQRWTDYRQWRDQHGTSRPDVELLGDDDILHLYTSGTTGLPKGVQLTNEGYVNVYNAFVDNDILNVDNRAVFINVMPLFHVGGVNLTVVPCCAAPRCICWWTLSQPRCSTPSPMKKSPMPCSSPP